MFADAQGDVQRGLQVGQYQCLANSRSSNLPLPSPRHYWETSSRSQKTWTPIPVVYHSVSAQLSRHLTFPQCERMDRLSSSARIVLWSAALATVTGNTLIVKPSERDPGATMIIAELCERAGIPPGVINV